MTSVPFKIMNIAITPEQPLALIIKKLTDLGYRHSGWFGIQSSSPLLVVTTSKKGTYEYYNHLVGISSFVSLSDLEMKTKYDWSDVPEEVKWIATDNTRHAFGYITKPKKYLDLGIFQNWIDRENKIFEPKNNPFKDDWQDSLEERSK